MPGGGKQAVRPRPAMRDELRDFKRQRVLEEASSLFYERGFVGTSMDALAERLGVGKPFIYQLFENKEALLVELYRAETERLLDLLDTAVKVDGPPSRRLAQFVRTFVKENIKNQAITSIFLQEEKHLPAGPLKDLRARQKHFDKTLAELIAEGVKDGTFRVANPHLASLAISGMILWIQRWYRPNGDLTLDEICSEFVRMAMNMIGHEV